MTDKETTGNVIRAVITLLVVVVIIAILAVAARDFFPGLYDIFKPGLGEDEKNHVLENFDTLIENIDACDQINDDNCICEVFPDFPVVFPAGTKLTLDENGVASLYYNNKLLKESEAIIYEEFFSINKKGDKIEINNINAGDMGTGSLTITFAEHYPQIENKLGKKYNRDIISNGFFIDRVGTQGPVSWISRYQVTEGTLEEIVTLTAEIPICVEGRQEAINKFESLINSLERYKVSVSLDMSQASESGQEFKVEIPENAIIKFDTSNMWLESGGKKIGDLLVVSASQNMDTFKIREVKSKIITLCSTSRQNGEIQNMEIIWLKKENNAICLHID